MTDPVRDVPEYLTFVTTPPLIWAIHARTLQQNSPTYHASSKSPFKSAQEKKKPFSIQEPNNAMASFIRNVDELVDNNKFSTLSEIERMQSQDLTP
jgi:hypothetical protein